MPEHIPCIMRTSISSISKTRTYESTRGGPDNHIHTYREGDLFSSRDGIKIHKHKLSNDSKTLLSTNAHTHTLRKEIPKSESMKELILLANMKGIHVSKGLSRQDLLKLIDSGNTKNVIFNR